MFKDSKYWPKAEYGVYAVALIAAVIFFSQSKINLTYSNLSFKLDNLNGINSLCLFFAVLLIDFEKNGNSRVIAQRFVQALILGLASVSMNPFTVVLMAFIHFGVSLLYFSEERATNFLIFLLSVLVFSNLENAFGGLSFDNAMNFTLFETILVLGVICFIFLVSRTEIIDQYSFGILYLWASIIGIKIAPFLDPRPPVIFSLVLLIMLRSSSSNTNWSRYLASGYYFWILLLGADIRFYFLGMLAPVIFETKNGDEDETFTPIIRVITLIIFIIIPLEQMTLGKRPFSFLLILLPSLFLCTLIIRKRPSVQELAKLLIIEGALFWS